MLLGIVSLALLICQIDLALFIGSEQRFVDGLGSLHIFVACGNLLRECGHFGSATGCNYPRL